MFKPEGIPDGVRVPGVVGFPEGGGLLQREGPVPAGVPTLQHQPRRHLF